MGREREIFKTSLMKGTKITACTLISYSLQHKETTSYIIYLSGFFSIIYSYWALHAYCFYFKYNTIITTTNIKVSRTDFYVLAKAYSGIVVEFVLAIFIIALPFDRTLLAEQVILPISIIINIFVLFYS